MDSLLNHPPGLSAGPAGLVLLFFAIGGLLIWRVGSFTSPSVLAWRMIAQHRGIRIKRPLEDRIAERLPFLSALNVYAEVPRLLFIVGRDADSTNWLIRQAGFGIFLFLCFFGLDEGSLIFAQWLLYPPALALVVGVAWIGLSYFNLRRQVKTFRQQADIDIADLLVPLAAITAYSRVSPDAAVRMFARCQKDGVLHSILENDRWRKLVMDDLRRSNLNASEALANTPDQFMAIGTSYNIPMFHELGAAVRRHQDRGLAPLKVYSELAASAAGDRMDVETTNAAAAEIYTVVPVGGQVLPLLALIGIPAAVQLFGAIAK